MNNNDLEILSCETEIKDINMNHIEFTNNYLNLKECLNNYLIDSKRLYKLLFNQGCIIDANATIFSKNIFEKYGLFDEGCLLVEDWLYWIRLSLSNDCIWGYNKLVCLKYRKGSGVTSLRPKGIDNDFFKIRKKYYPYFA